MRKKGPKVLFCCLLATLMVFGTGLVFAESMSDADVTESSESPAAVTEAGRSYIPVIMNPTITTESLGGYRYKVKANNLLWATHVQIPTWSQENGQDDIVWYTATHEGNGIWSAAIDAEPHGGGVMFSHVYANGMSVGSTSYVAPITSKPVVDVQQLGEKRFKITVSNLPWAKRVQIPTWSEINGQDDIVWHNAANDGGGKWSTYVDTTPHGGGVMISHVYADGKPIGSVTYGSATTPEIQIRVEPLGGSRFQVIAENMPWASKVQIPTWSEYNGQDDIIWYSATNDGEGRFSAVIDSNPHGGGNMISHVYADNKPVGSITYTGPSVARPTVTAEHIAGTDNFYRIRVRNLSWPSKVQIPTWSEQNGQDDIAWYKAGYDGYGTWTAVIDTAKHGGGYMISHVYADGLPVGSVSYVTNYVDKPTVNLQALGGSHYQVVIHNLAHGSKVNIMTWNQTTGKMLTTTADYTGNGTWAAAINAADFGPGTITSYVYADGKKIGEAQAVFQYTT